MFYFSKATGGFYTAEIHGARTVRQPDASWTRPRVSVTLQPGEQYFDGQQIVTNPGPEMLALHDVPDWAAEHPSVEVPNPDCKVPADAVEITAERHAELMAGQAAGALIVGDDSGQPILQQRAPVPLARQIEVALSGIDRETDRIYTDTIGCRGEEYRQAEADAHAFQAANYGGSVPPFVADHLAAKASQGWTARQACDDILATAGAWRSAQATIRANRLQCKELCRQAGDEAALTSALGQWAAFVAGVRASLGLAA